MLRRIILGVLALGFVVVIGAGAYIWFSGGSGEPSTDVTAPPIGTTDSPSTTGATTSEPGADPTVAEGPITYQISQEESTASFQIGEILRGQPNTVVGTTAQVAAEMLVDLEDPASAQLGTVVINARTLATDNPLRDRAIRSFILDSASDEFEFITFTPTSMEGLPSSLAQRGPISFTVTGDLTIRTVTQPVAFDVELTEVSTSRIAGRATATVTRSDFELTIPNVQQVAGVDEEVLVTLDFVARPVG